MVSASHYFSSNGFVLCFFLLLSVKWWRRLQLRHWRSSGGYTAIVLHLSEYCSGASTTSQLELQWLSTARICSWQSLPRLHTVVAPSPQINIVSLHFSFARLFSAAAGWNFSRNEEVILTDIWKTCLWKVGGCSAYNASYRSSYKLFR